MVFKNSSIEQAVTLQKPIFKCSSAENKVKTMRTVWELTLWKNDKSLIWISAQIFLLKLVEKNWTPYHTSTWLPSLRYKSKLTLSRGMFYQTAVNNVSSETSCNWLIFIFDFCSDKLIFIDRICSVISEKMNKLVQNFFWNPTFTNLHQFQIMLVSIKFPGSKFEVMAAWEIVVFQRKIIVAIRALSRIPGMWPTLRWDRVSSRRAFTHSVLGEKLITRVQKQSCYTTQNHPYLWRCLIGHIRIMIALYYARAT